MNFWEKGFEFLVSTVGQSAVDAWLQRSAVLSEVSKLRAALPKARLLIERSECWRLPKYQAIDELLPQLKCVVYEAEVITDEFEYQILKHEVEKSFPGKYYLTNWMTGFPTAVKTVLDRLDFVYEQTEKACNNLGIPENPNQFSNTARPITSTFPDSLDKPCGREKELNNVIRLLGVPISGSGGRRRKRESTSYLDIGQSNRSVEKKENISFLSILGIGGVGKTTLAQMVCKSTRVKSYFDLIMWVCVSDNCDLARLTREIIECATGNECNLTNLNLLQMSLNETLKSKRFLLVLDDVWSKEWQLLLGPIKGGSEGSAVVVTTRSFEFVEEASTSLDSRGVINLDGLEKDIYWQFFKSCAFGAEANPNNYPKLEAIGKEICGRLKGSPLAAKTIGGLLRTNLDEEHWRNIKNSEMWQLQKDERDILPVIQLSYQYLPSHLKKCFSFLSLYPKDIELTKEELTKFWIMHGFIKPLNNLQQQEVLAGRYFDELQRRNFFLEVTKPRNISYYAIHDLMHDVCQYITKDECFCLENEGFVQKASLDIRHISIFCKKLQQNQQIELCNYKKLFSLSIAHPSSCSPSTIDNWFHKLTTLHSLSLVKSKINELPESIGNLKHLQYLDISFTTIKMLPESFGSLYNLQYLNMEGCSYIIWFPEGSKKLVNLQFFRLPIEKWLLVCHMENVATAIQYTDVVIPVKRYKIEILKYIKKLRGSLAIYHLGDVPSKEAAEEAQLNNKPLIEKLVFSWYRSSSQPVSNEEVLQGLCPHPNLRKLKIEHYGGRNLSPSWLKEDFLPNLTEVEISFCETDFTISHLPCCITKLVIKSCYQLTNLENCLVPNHLPALKIMVIFNCIELVSLPVESFGGFVSLEMLTISYCPKLTCVNAMVLPPSIKDLSLDSCTDLKRSIPSCLKNLTFLEELRIFGFPDLVSIPAEVTSNLKSLSSLTVGNCAELQSLGGLQFLASLQSLNIRQCPKLEETGGQDIVRRLPSDLLANLHISSPGREKSARRARN